MPPDSADETLSAEGVHTQADAQDATQDDAPAGTEPPAFDDPERTEADAPGPDAPSEPLAADGSYTQADARADAPDDMSGDATAKPDAEADTASGKASDGPPDADRDAESELSTDDVLATAAATPLAADPEGAADNAAAPRAEGDDAPTERPAPERVVEKTVVERKGGLVPMLLGGAVAAALGFGAADYSQPGGFLGGAGGAEPDPFQTETRSALDAVAERISALEAQGTGLDESALTPLSDGLDAATQSLDALGAEVETLAEDQSALGARLDDLDARLTQLAQAPLEDNVSEAAIAAYEEAIAGYEREMAAMSESMAAQRAEIEGLAAEAASREAEAQALAQEARVQSAAAALIVQIESGAPFADALQNYLAAGGDPVDPALGGLADAGVPGLEQIQEDFAPAARAALAAARAADAPAGDDASDGAGGLGTFLARTLNTRSVTPRAGDDPDAVLSRAGDAVRFGDLDTALAEIATLPEVARAELADWETTATARRDALAAATALTAPDNSN